MARQKDIGVGVIGLGMGRNMLAINSDPESRLEVRAICDADANVLARARREWPDPGLYATADYRDILDRQDVDVVGIYTPDHLHFLHLSDALQAGKHVICTKPMVVSLEEAKATVDLVRRTNLKFMVGHTWRFQPRYMALRKLLEDGDLGRPLFVEAHYVHDMRPVMDRTPWRYEAPQDFLYGGACHPIDMLRSLAGDVDEVSCYAVASHLDPRYPKGKEDNFLINLRFNSGVIGRVMAAYGLVEPPLPMHLVAVYGTKGSVVNEKLVLDKVAHAPVWEAYYRREPGHGAEVLRYMRAFEDCLVNDTAPPVDVVEGAKCIAVCAAAWDSIRSGLPQKVFNEF